jgi:hypothetical protein
MEQRFRLREQGYDIDKVIEPVSELFSLSKQEIIKLSRQRQTCHGAECVMLLSDPGVGMSGSELSQILRLGQSSVNRAVGRGEKLVNKRNSRLIGV